MRSLGISVFTLALYLALGQTAFAEPLPEETGKEHWGENLWRSLPPKDQYDLPMKIKNPKKVEEAGKKEAAKMRVLGPPEFPKSAKQKDPIRLIPKKIDHSEEPSLPRRKEAKPSKPTHEDRPPRVAPAPKYEMKKEQDYESGLYEKYLGKPPVTSPPAALPELRGIMSKAPLSERNAPLSTIERRIVDKISETDIRMAEFFLRLKYKNTDEPVSKEDLIFIRAMARDLPDGAGNEVMKESKKHAQLLMDLEEISDPFERNRESRKAKDNQKILKTFGEALGKDSLGQKFFEAENEKFLTSPLVKDPIVVDNVLTSLRERIVTPSVAASLNGDLIRSLPTHK